MLGYLRTDGKKGIRNAILVCYLVECAKFVCEKIVSKFDDDIQLIGLSGCYPNEYTFNVLKSITTHQNVGAVLLVSLGCECFDKKALYKAITNSGREVEILTIQENSGTKESIKVGSLWVEEAIKKIKKVPREDIRVDELVIGTICGGSDGTSGISGNPAVGKAFDRFIKDGATCIFEETGELIGCEHIMANRAVNKKVAKDLLYAVQKAERYYTTMGHGSFSDGNATGGLTTQEEKSMGAYAKSGSSSISGVLKPSLYPKSKGLFLLDIVPDGKELWAFPNPNDTSEIIELIASGSHIILFVTGRGSVVGSAISPVIKICANPDTYKKLEEDMDINAGKIINGEATIEEIASEIYDTVLDVCGGKQSKSEILGHREFILGYKYFDNKINCF